MRGLQVLVDGSGISQKSYPVNTIEAGIEKRESLEDEWKREGFQRDGFNPARMVKGRRWRRAVVVRIVGDEEPESSGARGVQSQQIAKRGW